MMNAHLLHYAIHFLHQFASDLPLSLSLSLSLFLSLSAGDECNRTFDTCSRTGRKVACTSWDAWSLVLTLAPTTFPLLRLSLLPLLVEAWPRDSPRLCMRVPAAATIDPDCAVPGNEVWLRDSHRVSVRSASVPTLLPAPRGAEADEFRSEFRALLLLFCSSKAQM